MSYFFFKIWYFIHSWIYKSHLWISLSFTSPNVDDCLHILQNFKVSIYIFFSAVHVCPDNRPGNVSVFNYVFYFCLFVIENHILSTVYDIGLIFETKECYKRSNSTNFNTSGKRDAIFCIPDLENNTWYWANEHVLLVSRICKMGTTTNKLTKNLDHKGYIKICKSPIQVFLTYLSILWLVSLATFVTKSVGFTEKVVIDYRFISFRTFYCWCSLNFSICLQRVL